MIRSFITISLLVMIFVSCKEDHNKPVAIPLNESSMFTDMMDNHYSKIFPKGLRNAGGPMFFKYIYENLASSHDEFAAYNKFYCGVSGSIIMPNRQDRYTTVKIRDKNNQCIKGNYYRCCWPCSGDIMKYARVDSVAIKLPKQSGGDFQQYNVLTINDPCQTCEGDNCESFPEEVGAFKCFNGLTKNGLRVSDGKLTEGDGRLVFALFHPSKKDDIFDPNFLKICSKRHNANLSELDQMGGMGNIFVKLATLYKNESYSVCKD